MSYSNNRQFSTFDADNDMTSANCAVTRGGGGGFWYNACGYVYINAVPSSNFIWYYSTANAYALYYSEVRLLC